MEAHLGPEEINRLQNYLRRKVNPDFRLVTRKQTDDSVEVYLAEEFVAVIYKDVDEGEISYQFQMTILVEDLGGD